MMNQSFRFPPPPPPPPVATQIQYTHSPLRGVQNDHWSRGNRGGRGSLEGTQNSGSNTARGVFNLGQQQKIAGYGSYHNGFRPSWMASVGSISPSIGQQNGCTDPNIPSDTMRGFSFKQQVRRQGVEPQRFGVSLRDFEDKSMQVPLYNSQHAFQSKRFPFTRQAGRNSSSLSLDSSQEQGSRMGTRNSLSPAPDRSNVGHDVFQYSNSAFISGSPKHRDFLNYPSGHRGPGQRQGFGYTSMTQDQISRPRAAPVVPSFGGPLPIPTKPPVDEGRTVNRPKKKRKHNQLGLTPVADEHKSSEEEEDYADEEVRLAAAIAGSRQEPLLQNIACSTDGRSTNYWLGLVLSTEAAHPLCSHPPTLQHGSKSARGTILLEHVPKLARRRWQSVVDCAKQHSIQ